MLVCTLEALYFCLLLDKTHANELVISWTSTLTEAFFLQMSLFDSGNSDESAEYSIKLIERIQGLIDRRSATLCDLETIPGQLESLINNQDVLKAKI